MKKIIEGLQNFKQNIHNTERDRYQFLAAGQDPKTMFITCSDSRIVSQYLLGFHPGEVFVVRNAGNIVPPYDQSIGGVEATVEMALKKLNLEHIIVCGHSDCGAMTLLTSPDKLKGLPQTEKWLTHSHAALDRELPVDSGLPDHDPVSTAVANNVVIQMNNLKTYPTVTEKLERGEIQIHGWVYRIETGDVFEYRTDEERWVLLN